MFIDQGELRRGEREDRSWFERRPDREYRLRRAWPAVCDEPPPAGFQIFTICHRYDVEDFERQATFGAPITFETNRTDAEIRDVLQALATNPLAMLTVKR